MIIVEHILILNSFRFTIVDMTTGKHSFRVRSISLGQSGPFSNYIYMNVSVRVSTVFIALSIAAFILLSGAVSSCMLLLRQYRRPPLVHDSDENILLQEIVLAPYVHHLHIQDDPYQEIATF